MNAHKRKKLFRMALAEQKLQASQEPVAVVEEVPAVEVEAQPQPEVVAEQVETAESTEAAPAKKGRKKVVEQAAE